MHWWIDTRDKPGLLWAFLDHFLKDSRVSFEGDLAKLRLSEVPGLSIEETPILQRNTLEPRLDFVSVPISADSVQALKKRLSQPGLFDAEGSIVHVQVENSGQLVLGAYDNFHKDCVVAYEPTPEWFLARLRDAGVIRGFELAAE